MAHARYGKKSHASLIEPARLLAKNGFKITSTLARQLNEPSVYTGDIMAKFYNETARIWYAGGTPVPIGYLQKQPDLAKTFKLIQDHGVRVLYESGVAAGVEIPQAIIDAVKESVPIYWEDNCYCSGPSGGSIMSTPGNLTKQDFLDYTATEEEPVTISYRGFTIKSMGSPSSGGYAIGQQLGVMEKFALGTGGLKFGTASTLNLYIKTHDIAFSDRGVWVGDADFLPYNLDDMLDPDYVSSRADLVGSLNDPNSRGSTQAGTPPGFVDSLGDLCPSYSQAGLSLASAAEIEKKNERRRGSTTHYTIIDKHGNVASVTTTIEQNWGTGITVPGYGFLLNNELTDFNWSPKCNLNTVDGTNPGANDAGPGKRPRSSMSPTIVFDRNGDVVAALGTLGGASMIDHVTHTISNLIDQKMSAREAVDASFLQIFSGAIIFDPPPIPAFPGRAALETLYAAADEYYFGTECGPSGFMAASARKNLNANNKLESSLDCGRACDSGTFNSNTGTEKCDPTCSIVYGTDC